VSIVIYPLSLMRMAMKAVDEGLAALAKDGGFEPSLARMQSRKELYELLSYTPGKEWDFPRG
jgi:methylisocitrate lyase